MNGSIRCLLTFLVLKCLLQATRIQEIRVDKSLLVRGLEIDLLLLMF
jgi:hypothetical protein